MAVYGSTEAEPISHIGRSEISNDDMQAMTDGAGLLVGWPVKEIRIAVIAAAWGTPLGAISAETFSGRCQPPGEAGEVAVSGGHVLKGYLHGIGDEETKFRVAGEIWHRTGDCGYFDGQGRLWLLGRAAAVISDAHGRLYPFAVECAARHLPGVARAALVGSNGRRTLFVQPRRKAVIDTEQLRATLHWAQLDDVCLRHEIPLDKRHNAKVDYTRLR